MKDKNKIFIHFNTYKTTLYNIENDSIIKVNESRLFFNETLVNKELCDKIDNYLYDLNTKIKLDNKNTRLYEPGIFQELSNEGTNSIEHTCICKTWSLFKYRTKRFRKLLFAAKK